MPGAKDGQVMCVEEADGSVMAYTWDMKQFKVSRCGLEGGAMHACAFCGDWIDASICMCVSWGVEQCMCVRCGGWSNACVCVCLCHLEWSIVRQKCGGHLVLDTKMHGVVDGLASWL